MAVGCLAAMVVAVISASAQQAPREFPKLSLPSSTYGQDAIMALGSNLPAVAAWYGMTADELRREFRRYYDTAGYLLPTTDQGYWILRSNGSIAVFERLRWPGSFPVGELLYPVSSTLRLHSNPESSRTISIEFATPNASRFTEVNDKYSVSEIVAIQHIWTQVAEYFAPFDVNVTTEAAEADSIYRSSAEDKRFGYSVTIDNLNPSFGNTGYVMGEVQLKSFGSVGGDQPAFRVFGVSFKDNPRAMAGMISHLLGHALGLQDDTERVSRYQYSTNPSGDVNSYRLYFGHMTPVGSWTSIMGVPFYADIAQFSRSEFPGAVNQQDSFAIMQRNGLQLRRDDAGFMRMASRLQTSLPASSGTSAAPAITGTFNGVIERQTDWDTVYFHAGTGPLTASLAASNVNVGLWLLDGRGNVLARNEDPNSLGASLNFNVTRPGTYFLQVRSMAVGDPATGIPAYGNGGSYTLNASYRPSPQQEPYAAFTASQTGRPDVVQGGAIVDTPITLNGRNSSGNSWGVAVSSYSWDFGDGTFADTGPSSLAEKTYARPGTYTVSLRVTGSNGLSSITQKQIVVGPRAF